MYRVPKTTSKITVRRPTTRPVTPIVHDLPNNQGTARALSASEQAARPLPAMLKEVMKPVPTKAQTVLVVGEKGTETTREMVKRVMKQSAPLIVKTAKTGDPTLTSFWVSFMGQVYELYYSTYQGRGAYFAHVYLGLEVKDGLEIIKHVNGYAEARKGKTRKQAVVPITPVTQECRVKRPERKAQKTLIIALKKEYEGLRKIKYPTLDQVEREFTLETFLIAKGVRIYMKDGDYTIPTPEVIKAHHFARIDAIPFIHFN